jgi:hypothetical protein
MAIYAGVPLTPPSAELAAWVEARLPPSEVHAAPWRDRARPVRLGSLYWPLGASQWGEAWYVCTEAQLNLIRPKVYANNRLRPEELVLDDGTRQLRGKMWMLTPRPLAGAPGENRLFLIPLVDDRYWWWDRRTDDLQIQSGTSWQVAARLLLEKLGIDDFQQDTISPNYLTAPSLLFRDEPVPPVIDRVFRACGQRLVRHLDGSIELLGLDSTINRVKVELGTIRPVHAGGVPALDVGKRPDDLPTVLPRDIRILYPKVVDGSPTGDYFGITMNLRDLGVTGAAWRFYNETVTFKSGAVANYLSEDLSNRGELLAIARETGRDWVERQMLRHDLLYAGLHDWTLEGASTIEWIDREEGSYTRVRTADLDTPLTYRRPDQRNTGGGGGGDDGGGGGGGDTYIYQSSSYGFYFNSSTIVNNTTINISQNIFYYFIGGGWVVISTPLKIKDALWYNYDEIDLPDLVNNDVNPHVDLRPDRVVYRLTAAEDVQITGWVPRYDTGTGQYIILTNASDFEITLTHDDAASTDFHRFLCPRELGYVLGPYEGVALWWDPEATRWKLIDSLHGGLGANGARYTRGSQQTIPDVTWTTIEWDSGIYSTRTYWDPMDDPTILTAQATGIHHLGAFVCFDSTATPSVKLGLRILTGNDDNPSGSVIAEQDSRQVSATSSGMADPHALSLHTEYYLTEGDWVKVQVFQDTGGNLDILYTTGPAAWISEVGTSGAGGATGGGGGGGGLGTVTSVGLAAPGNCTVSGSPVTGTGTLTWDWNVTSGVLLVGAGAGNDLTELAPGAAGGFVRSNGTAWVRSTIASGDLPAHNHAAGDITSGTLATARGGTGLDTSGATNGQLLIGNGTGLSLAALTAGSGISITNGAGSITIAATGSGITSLGGQTGAAQTFSRVNDTNVTLTITSGTDNHEFSLGWSGTLAVARGGTASGTAAGARTNLGAAASGNNTDITHVHLQNTGLQLQDSDGSHYLIVTAGSNLSTDRTLTIITGDADRSLTIGASASVSGSNTGDQNIILTGDVTGGGTGSFAATIASGAVTLAKMADIATDRLIGRDTAGTGVPEALTVGGGIEFTGSGGIQATAASDTVAGKIEIAVQSELESASSTTLAVTPGRMQYHPGVAKAWVQFTGTGTVTINASHNVSSITDHGAGDYSVNWDTDFSSDAYAAFALGSEQTQEIGGAPAAGSWRFRFRNTTWTLSDSTYVCVVAFGDQ